MKLEAFCFELCSGGIFYFHSQFTDVNTQRSSLCFYGHRKTQEFVSKNWKFPSFGSALEDDEDDFYHYIQNHEFAVSIF